MGRRRQRSVFTLFTSLPMKRKKRGGIWEEANKEREVVNTGQRRAKKIVSLKRQEGT